MPHRYLPAYLHPLVFNASLLLPAPTPAACAAAAADAAAAAAGMGSPGFRDEREGNPFELPSVDDLEVAALAAASAMQAIKELQQAGSEEEVCYQADSVGLLHSISCFFARDLKMFVALL